MLGFLIKKFIKDGENVHDRHVRERYCVLSGVIGIICNLFLFATKLIAGILSSSVAVISDSFNNLSDGGSSVITIIGSRLANKHPDSKHPFGHGRLEYISSLFIAMIVVSVGFQLGKGSIGKIISPTEVKTDAVVLIILFLSLFVKLWLFYINRRMGKKIGSQLLLDTGRDSINDVIATCAVILSSVLDKYVPFSLDGVIGCAVSVYILYSGVKMALDTIGVLLGSPPDEKTVADITRYVTSPSEIVGIHDLIVHDYGPGRIMATVHAEVSDSSDILKIHEVIDETEQKILDELGILTVIHMDPIATQDELACRLRTLAAEVTAEINGEFSIHDLRIVKGENRINVIFDVVVPQSFDDRLTEQLKSDINEGLKAHDERLNGVIKVEHKYCN